MNWAWPPWRGSVLVHVGVVVAAAVVQVEHGIPGVAVGLVARRQVDVHPLLFPGVVRVGRLLDLAVGDVGLRRRTRRRRGRAGPAGWAARSAPASASTACRGGPGRPAGREARLAPRPSGPGPCPLRGASGPTSGPGRRRRATRPRPARARPSRGADAMRAWCPTPGEGLVRPRTIEIVATERPLPGRNNQKSWWSLRPDLRTGQGQAGPRRYRKSRPCET